MSNVTLLNWVHNSQAKFSSTAKLILFCSWINKVRKKKTRHYIFELAPSLSNSTSFRKCSLMWWEVVFIPSPNPASPQETLFRAAPSFVRLTLLCPVSGSFSEFSVYCQWGQKKKCGKNSKLPRKLYMVVVLRVSVSLNPDCSS